MNSVWQAVNDWCARKHAGEHVCNCRHNL